MEHWVQMSHLLEVWAPEDTSSSASSSGTGSSSAGGKSSGRGTSSVQQQQQAGSGGGLSPGVVTALWRRAAGEKEGEGEPSWLVKPSDRGKGVTHRSVHTPMPTTRKG
jgi:hypothetical protein